jgi:small-conductance mechanosensitive channel
LFFLLSFVCISEVAFSQGKPNDSLNLGNIDSLSQGGLQQQDTLKSVAVVQYSKIGKIKFSLDSLNHLTTYIINNLDSTPDLPQDTLLSFRSQIINAQEKAASLGKLAKDYQNTETDSLELINESYDLYFKIGSLKGRIDERIRKLENLTIKKKAGYIWTAPIKVKPKDLYNSLKSEKTNSISTLNKIKNSEWGGLFLLFLLSAGYFYWIFKNKQGSVYHGTKTNLPIIQSVLFFLVLIPLFDRQITSLYIEFILLLILFISFFKFRNYVKIKTKRWWLSLISIYVLTLLFNYLLASNGLIIRVIVISLNLIALYFGYKTVNILKRANSYPRIYRSLFAVYLLLNVFAIILNIVGQINVSKTFSITAIAGMAQLVGLIVLGKIIIENFNTQFEAIKKSKHFLSNLNKTKTLPFIHKTLLIIGSTLWLIVFLTNLNIIDSTLSFFDIILSKPHTFGNISFTLGNVIICVIIIGIANWFQKNLDILLSTNHSKKFETQVDQKGTKVTLLRLAVIILGFLFGVTALGISMNKLTVILGALSVGIGLGMQNIFNNFVSGVILIFEKPFKIGDFIELADKKGRVQKIGIRSSTLLTEQGSEVIIPNGDLLSGRLVNWTHSQSYYKVELSLKFNTTSNLEEVNQIILEEIKKNEYSIKEGTAEVLYNSISANALELIVKCWITSIYNESQFKSSLLEALRNRFINNEILTLG